jgi:glc operon protein GlcG
MKKLLHVVLALMLAATALCARAQSYGAPITLEQARKVMAAAEAEARKNNLNMAIAIVDSGGHMVLMQRMDGAFFASAKVAGDKAWSAAAYRRPGKALQDRLATGGAEIRILRLQGASPIEGGDPIMADGKVVGAIGVSGGSGEQDGVVSRAGAGALK